MLTATSTTVVTPPNSEPVTLAEAKQHCRIDDSEDDDMVTGYIAAARQHVERISGLTLLPTVYRSNYTGWPASSDALWLHGCPVLASTDVAVQYTDSDGNTQTLSTSVYTVDTDHKPARILLKPNQSWPALQSGAINPVRVTYTAGYAETDDVPPACTLAMRLIIAHLYRNREATTIGVAAKELPMGVCDILAPFQVRYGY